MNEYNRMDKLGVTQKAHEIKINNRKDLEISGVKEIDSFDNEEFLIETVMGYLIIRGQQLQLKNLNVDDGLIQIKGKIFELMYVEQEHDGKSKGFLHRLFK